MNYHLSLKVFDIPCIALIIKTEKKTLSKANSYIFTNYKRYLKKDYQK